LVELGADVRVLDDLSGGFAENVPTRATLIRASVIDGGASVRACRCR